MKNILLFLILACTSITVFGQTAYIQVNGEPGLSIYLNNQFKGKTTAEYNGYIIENVTAGTHLIKIVKEGFTPYEETITIKPGEVFAYKVKPFTKHIVNISEQGSTGETDKKAIIETGKLIIQSVPIEIKITMPDIEGISNSPKTKDEWVADKIPAGSYKITFTFNQKTISKTVEITGNETTSVFVNMLSGDFKTKNSLEEKLEKEREDIEKNKIGEEAFMNYAYFKYYDIGLTLVQAKIKFPEYFNSYNTYKYSDQILFDRAYSSKNSEIGLTLYGKDGKIVGCYGTLQGRTEDDASFTKGNKALSEIVDDLTAKFNFSPIKTFTPYNQDGYKYDYISYTWEKNGKTLSIISTQWYFSNGYTTEIHLTQFDN